MAKGSQYILHESCPPDTRCAATFAEILHSKRVDNDLLYRQAATTKPCTFKQRSRRNRGVDQIAGTGLRERGNSLQLNFAGLDNDRTCAGTDGCPRQKQRYNG